MDDQVDSDSTEGEWQPVFEQKNWVIKAMAVVVSTIVITESLQSIWSLGYFKDET